MFCVSRTRVRAVVRLCAVVLPMWAPAFKAWGQSTPCETSTNASACPAAVPVQPSISGGTVASAKALRAAVGQADGPIAARIRSLTGGQAGAGGALFPQQHYRVLALGNAGQKLETSDPKIRALEKRLGVDPSSNAIKPRIGIWTDGTASDQKFSDAGTEFEGQIWSGIAGVDYAFSDRLTLGLAGSFERQEYDLSRANSSVEGSGVTAAPYAVFKLDDNFSLDAAGGYSWLDYSSSWTDPVTRARATASSGAYRWFGASNLSGTFAFEQWRLGGRIGSLYACETQDALSVGAASPSADHALAVGSLRLGYEFSVLDGFQPYVSAIGRYAYMDGDPADRTDATLGAGAELQAGRATLGIQGSSVEGREGVRNYTAGFNIRLGF